jgi:ABC-2 type transport system ATP-binding protein
MGEGRLVTLSGDFSAAQLGEAIARSDTFRPIELGDGTAMLLLPREHAVGSGLERLFTSGLALRDVQVKEPNLEDLFLKLTGRELRD